MRYQNEIPPSLWEWRLRLLHASHEDKRGIVPERPVRIGGDEEREPPPLVVIAAAWALVLALGAVAFVFSAIP